MAQPTSPQRQEDDPPPEVIAELNQEMMKRVKETAEKIKDRVKKATDDTGEVAKLDTDEQPRLND